MSVLVEAKIRNLMRMPIKRGGIEWRAGPISTVEVGLCDEVLLLHTNSSDL